MPNLLSGTVTFAFSDIEGSTDLLKRLGDERYAEVLRTHRRIMRETFGAHHGQEIDTQGDAFFYSFPRARDAVAAAVDVQRAHEHEPWPEGVSVRIRLGPARPFRRSDQSLTRSCGYRRCATPAT